MQRLSKIQVTKIFLMKDMLFPQIYRDSYRNAMLVPIRMGTNMAAEYVTVFCYKSINWSFEELKIE